MNDRCYKPIWPTAPRDFSLLCSWGSLEDGTSYLLNRSVDHPQNPPVKVRVPILQLAAELLEVFASVLYPGVLSLQKVFDASRCR